MPLTPGLSWDQTGKKPSNAASPRPAVDRKHTGRRVYGTDKQALAKEWLRRKSQARLDDADRRMMLQTRRAFGNRQKREERCMGRSYKAAAATVVAVIPLFLLGGLARAPDLNSVSWSIGCVPVKAVLGRLRQSSWSEASLQLAPMLRRFFSAAFPTETRIGATVERHEATAPFTTPATGFNAPRNGFHSSDPRPPITVAPELSGYPETSVLKLLDLKALRVRSRHCHGPLLGATDGLSY